MVDCLNKVPVDALTKLAFSEVLVPTARYVPWLSKVSPDAKLRLVSVIVVWLTKVPVPPMVTALAVTVATLPDNTFRATKANWSLAASANACATTV